jgi:putative aldouronate transport system permease protein
MAKKYAIEDSMSEKAFNVFNIVFMLGMVVVTLYPMLYVLFASLSLPGDFIAHSGLLLQPLGITLSSYKAVFDNPNIISGYVNTIIIVVFGVALNILLTAIGAYFLSRKNVMWRDPVMFLIIFTMFFGGGLIPFFFTVKWLHIDNTLLALILPSAISTFNLIIMRTAFAAIPDSIEESARMDGAGHFTILFRIIIPLAMPTIAVMILYYGVHHWNSWFHAMIFLQKRELFPLQLILREILIQNDTSLMVSNVNTGDEFMIAETVKYAVIVVATVPILLLYPFLQRYFVKGIMIGSLKE